MTGPYSTVIAKSGQRNSQSMHLLQSSGRATFTFPPSISSTFLGQKATQISQPLHHPILTLMITGFFEAGAPSAIFNLSGLYQLAQISTVA